MDAIKVFFIMCLFIPTILFGQKSKYPKDTIYIKYQDTIFNNPKMKSKSFHNFQGNDGIKFWWNGKWLFYNKNQKTDTLCISHIKDYSFLNLKEIRVKEIDWVERKFVTSKYKPYSGSKNAVFNTFLIEIISEDKFVIYPVIWRNEGVID